MRRSLVFSASLLLATVVVAACGSDADSDEALSSDGDAMSDDGGAANPSDAASDGAMSHDGGGHGEPSPVAPGARRIEVEATSLRFTPTEIRVRAGEDIAIALTSDDMLHDFTVDELGAHVPADAGETVEGGFHAAEPGRYSFYCSVEGHREGGMEGTLVVE